MHMEIRYGNVCLRLSGWWPIMQYMLADIFNMIELLHQYNNYTGILWYILSEADELRADALMLSDGKKYVVPPTFSYKKNYID